MFFLPFVQQAFVVSSIFFAVPLRSVSDKKKRPTTWFIDGNNFLGQKGTPRDGNILVEKLKPITTTAAEQVVLVFDGKKGERTRQDTMNGPLFRLVQLEEGMIADNFIVQEIHAIAEANKSNRVKLVTADKRLRTIALSTRPTVKTVVNPKVFWKKYLPRMSGIKKRLTVNDEEGQEEKMDVVFAEE